MHIRDYEDQCKVATETGESVVLNRLCSWVSKENEHQDLRKNRAAAVSSEILDWGGGISFGDIEVS